MKYPYLKITIQMTTLTKSLNKLGVAIHVFFIATG
jgi:hypothetical protein